MKTRTKQPANNKYYMRIVSGGYSGAIAGYPMVKNADVLCNCVGYAGSRFNEIINDPDLKGIGKKFKYQLVCNAENFIESAKKQGLKISDVPIQGGIMVWQRGATLNGSDGAGHVAVVEEVYEDGSILTSESGYAAWAFKTIRRTNDNGRWGQTSAYKFRGCIINPSVKNPKVAPTPKLSVDGIGGMATVRAMQKYFATPQDGVISGQNKKLKKYYPSLISVEYGKGGSTVIKSLQKWLGVSIDGVLGEQTVKAWQKKLGVEADGIFGTLSMKAWQKYLNDRLFPTNVQIAEPPKADPSVEKDEAIETPKEDTTTEPIVKDVYKVIDVSDWQDKIDWSKVKKSGVTGAIIRYADGDTLDKRFTENMVNAKAEGLHLGAYIFSRATTKEEAQSEAVRLFNACQPYALDMPLYIDLEVAKLSGYANVVAQAFLNKMASLGAKGGVYANLNWWNNYLADTAKDYSASPFWIAQYNDKITYKDPSLFGMWQYTSSGSVDGISGKVDMNECYVPYWETCKMPKLTANEMAAVVLDGKMGNADVRKAALTAAGYDYDEVQSEVNRLVKARSIADMAVSLCGSKTAATPKYEEAAKSVYGKGNDTNCHRFVGVVLAKCGYPKMPINTWSNILKYLRENFTEIPVDYTEEQLQTGDIRVRKTDAGKYHIWIIIGKGKKAEAAHNKTYPHTASNSATKKYASDWLFRVK